MPLNGLFVDFYFDSLWANIFLAYELVNQEDFPINYSVDSKFIRKPIKNLSFLNHVIMVIKLRKNKKKVNSICHTNLTPNKIY